jgi:hypothetical protein
LSISHIPLVQRPDGSDSVHKFSIHTHWKCYEAGISLDNAICAFASECITKRQGGEVRRGEETF